MGLRRTSFARSGQAPRARVCGASQKLALKSLHCYIGDHAGWPVPFLRACLISGLPGSQQRQRLLRR
eukprot:15482467-Alexandrium_andersonii.AAC.1